MSVNVISKKQMFKEEKQQKYLRDCGGCSRVVDVIQGYAKELLGEREIHIPRLEKRVGLKKGESIKFHWKKYFLFVFQKLLWKQKEILPSHHEWGHINISSGKGGHSPNFS